MGQRDGFAGGFLAGALVGGVVGGIIGAIAVNRRDAQLAQEEESNMGSPRRDNKDKTQSRRQIPHSESERVEMETARRSLEDKIAQLNATIDEVQQQLGDVNSNYAQQTNEKIVTLEE
ncbi:MAG: hypothetical protein AAF208_07120 [Cyanobacteria bacterium P01_A01_bin.45]